MPKRKNPKVSPIEELKKKNTKELLGYLKRLHQCEDSFELSDIEENSDLTDANIIYFKQTKKWQTAYKNVKSILTTREHI